MRLLGIHKMPNRFRVSDDNSIPQAMDTLQDTKKEKQISSTPLRFRSVKNALAVEDQGTTHKVDDTLQSPPKSPTNEDQQQAEDEVISAS